MTIETQEPQDGRREAFGERLSETLRAGRTYTVRHASELGLFDDLSDSELREFARRHGLNVVRRMGGSQIDFTPWAKARVA
ncbi:MAG: hypothetical protein HKN23_05900 [Verrucomicrobiales bacterium]|nr:hypothetical protein [Verrucomicrobiales bacterium]